MNPSSTHPTLVAAKAVVAEIAGLGIAASNREFSNRSLGEAETERRFQALDSGLARVNDEQDLNTYALLDKPSIKAAALLVAQHRAGNCQEQSALAFHKLAGLGVRPVELMSIREQDHVLVVAGRISGTEADFNTWNEDAVICDAWAKRAYFVYALPDEMQTIKSVTNGETRMIQKFKLDRNQPW